VVSDDIERGSGAHQSAGSGQVARTRRVCNQVQGAQPGKRNARIVRIDRDFALLVNTTPQATIISGEPDPAEWVQKAFTPDN
ncbi:MAG: hypothetical protein ABI859_20720, partial [Pseudomonadota bacterium]